MAVQLVKSRAILLIRDVKFAELRVPIFEPLLRVLLGALLPQGVQAYFGGKSKRGQGAR